MTRNKPSEMAMVGLKCLREAVRDEIRKKALLGQYVIIMRNGKAAKVPAKEALRMFKKK